MLKPYAFWFRDPSKINLSFQQERLPASFDSQPAPAGRMFGLMEHDQLIEKAKSHLSGTVSPETTPPNAQDLPEVLVRETALVHFFNEDRKYGAWVLLDKTNGAFIGGWSRGLEGTQGSMTEIACS